MYIHVHVRVGVRLDVHVHVGSAGGCLLQSEHFPFLGVGGAGGGGQASALRDLRCRTTFYTALGRLLMVELGEDEEKFEQFMMPLTSQ